MSAIARAAGTGMGTIYNYFATKEDLINAIYLYVKQSEIALVMKSMDPGSSLKAQFMSFYTAFIHFYLKYPESFAFIDQMQNSPVIQAGTKEAGRAAFLPVVELIQRGQKDGIIKQMELEAILFFLAGTVTPPTCAGALGPANNIKKNSWSCICEWYGMPLKNKNFTYTGMNIQSSMIKNSMIK